MSNTPTPDFTGLRIIPIDTSVPDWDSSKNQPNPKDIPSSEPLQLKPNTNKTLPSAVQPLPTPKDVYDTTVEGGKQFIQGTQELGQGPSSGSSTAEAIHDVISGGMKAGTVPMGFAAAVDPLLALGGLAESKAGQVVGEKGATALGASPETAQAVGDVASLVAPAAAHMIPPRPEGSAFLPNKEAGQIDFSGLRVVPDHDVVYRARPEGQEGIKVTEGSHAHATANEAEAHQYADNLNTMSKDNGENTKHVVDKIDLSKVPFGDYDVMNGPNGHDWIKFKTDQPEDIFKKTSTSEKSSPKDVIEKQGLVYKGELTKGSDVHMFEHPEFPGKTAALNEKDISPESVKDKMNSKLDEFGVKPKGSGGWDRSPHDPPLEREERISELKKQATSKNSLESRAAINILHHVYKDGTEGLGDSSKK